MKKLLFFAVAIIIAAMAGCKNESKQDEKPAVTDSLGMLTSQIRAMKLPVYLADGCTADSLWLTDKDSTLNIRMTLAEDFADSASLNLNRRSQIFAFSMLLTNDTLARALETARCVPVNISVIISATGLPEPVNMVIPRGEFHSMVLEAPDERSRDEVKVFNRVSSDNRYCPYELEEGVTMLSMNIQDRYVTFRTVIDDEMLDFHVMKENRDSVNMAVITALREQLEDSLQRKSLKEISFARLGYRNRYICSDMSDSFDITFTPADIERLISTADSIRLSKNTHKDKKKK